MRDVTRPEHSGVRIASLELEVLRQALIKGEQSGEDAPLDAEEIRREARKEAGRI